MEKRKFGRTGHFSTVAILGGAAFWDSSQEETDEAFELAIKHGVNHIDIAPSYGKAEALAGPWIQKMRHRFFLGCKTTEREKETAARELHESLTRLQTDHFDLYQCHAVTDLAELDKVTAKGGALEAMVAARESGLTRYLGITTHSMQAPVVLLEALKRFDFDTVLFPLNFILFSDPTYRAQTLDLIEVCQARDVGMMVIKAIARGRWGDLEKTHTTWYQPFTEEEQIRQAVNFVLSLPVTGICTAGDTRLLPKILKACEAYTLLSPDEAETLIINSERFVNEPLF